MDLLFKNYISIWALVKVENQTRMKEIPKKTERNKVFTWESKSDIHSLCNENVDFLLQKVLIE
jgi:hypothetical protein